MSTPPEGDALIVWYRCGRKLPFPSHETAVAEVRRAHPPTYGAYPCPYTDHWHVGHQSTHPVNTKTRRRARQLWMLREQRVERAA